MLYELNRSFILDLSGVYCALQFVIIFDSFISAPSRFTMEPELIEFLKKRRVPSSVIEKMEDTKVTFYYLKFEFVHALD